MIQPGHKRNTNIMQLKINLKNYIKIAEFALFNDDKSKKIMTYKDHFEWE